MLQKIRVVTNKEFDLKGFSIQSELNGQVSSVRTARVYRLEGVGIREAKLLADKLFCESINQQYSLNEPLSSKNLHVVEVAYKPGVMNPEVGSILKAAADLGIKLVAADASWEYHFSFSSQKHRLDDVLQQLKFFNPIVEYLVKDEPRTLLVKGEVGVTVNIPLRNMNDEELLKLSRDTLFLNLSEMKIVQKYFQKIKKDPTDCELETIAQTWSEHCAHKTFKAKLRVDGKEKSPLISRIQNEALKHKKNIVSAFVDNSGVMDFYEGFAICGKVETHNSPSAIEPYGGAMTGSGGVFRDVLGTGHGAKTIASTDIFCFAPPDLPLKSLPPGCLPPDYLLKRVVTGVRDYGNRMGIPTNNGSIHFHPDFRAKPTVIVGAYGIIPTKHAKKGKAKTGDLVVAIGGRTGRDGIHGATFSSAEMTDRTITVNSAAVQIGNAIEEKRMFDALVEARDKNLIGALQDCGAGGFSSAIGEMGETTGVTIDLAKAALKYPGLAPWEIWISESQERMIAAIPKTKLKEFLEICKKYNVEASTLGAFDGSHTLQVYYGKKRVADLSMRFLHHGLPQREMKASRPDKSTSKKNDQKNPVVPKTEKDWIKVLRKVLSHGNICSKEPIVRLYDHSVQGTNDLQPYGGEHMDAPNDAVVLRPFLDKPYGIIVSHGLNPVLNTIDPYWGSIWAAAEAISNYVAVGGDYKNASLINNYIWPFPDSQSLWSLDRSVDAVIDFMNVLKIPVISGKDSLSSTYRGKDGFVLKIPPVLCMSVFGKIRNASKTATADFKRKNSVVCLVGKQDLDALGGSLYFEKEESVPRVDLDVLPHTLTAVYNGIRDGQILSAHDISEGGLIVSLFEMCIGGDCGARIDTKSVSQKRADYVLFNETSGCFVVEVKNKTSAKRLFKNVPYAIIGNTQEEKKLSVNIGSKTLFQADLESLKKAWKAPMQKLFP